jgi:hypothetical protein
MSPWDIKRGLRAVIELLARTHPAGLRVLLGEYEPPSAEEIRDMLGATRGGVGADIRVDGGKRLPEAVRLLETAEIFNRFVDAAGGWGHITRMAREWAGKNSGDWALMVDHARDIRHTGHRWLGGAKLRRIADAYGCSGRTVTKKRRLFAAELAEYILLSPMEAKKRRAATGG